jgi:transcriptional regulator
MQDLPEPYVASMLNGIVGVEIAVERLEGKFKLSQNRPAGDRPRIIAALERRDDADSRGVAHLMREREPAAE